MNLQFPKENVMWKTTIAWAWLSDAVSAEYTREISRWSSQ